jgi:ATP-binding cassette subfamily F protein uup
VVQPSSPAPAAPARKRLSYHEVRELASIEKTIADAEKQIAAKRLALEDPLIVKDARRLQTACVEMAEAQKIVEKLYARWAELEGKKAEAQELRG